MIRWPSPHRKPGLAHWLWCVEEEQQKEQEEQEKLNHARMV